jgi:hypothetical protein
MTGVWLVIVAMTACSGFLTRPTAPEPTEQWAECEEAECECECSAELEELAACLDAPPPEPEPRRIKVITRAMDPQAPAKKCGGKGPDIKPVKSTTCVPGQLCLDETNQARMLANELAYRSWIAAVQECEAGQ